MVKSAVAKKATTARPKKQYRRQSNGTPLYPSIYDSCVFYFNYSILYNQPGGGVPIATPGALVLTSQVTQNNNFCVLANYFSRYRVEKICAIFTMADSMLFQWTEFSVAEIHDTKPWAIANASVDSQKNLLTYGNNTSKIQCNWKMNPTLISDTQFQDIPSAVPALVNANGGILWYIKGPSQPVAGCNACMSVNYKYKVRFQGRMSINI